MNQHNFFFVNKFLACFLSPKVSSLLSKNSDRFQIQIENVQHDPKSVIDSLIGLLSGSSILIDKFNYSIFQKVFKSLGNNDFQLFFDWKPPQSSGQFFLSLNSLKNIPKSNIEKNSFSPFSLDGFSIPIGLVHLFWGNHVKIPCNLFSKYNQIQIHDFAQIFIQLKRGFFIPLNQDQKAFFQSFSIHKTLLHHLAKNNSYFSGRSLSSSPRSMKPHPSHHIVPCLSHISLQTPPAQ
jgi:hypothetical protein